MTKKSIECYDAVFDCIRNELFKLQPTEFITDFEAGMRQSIRKNFPEATLRGCWFHYKRAVRQKCSKLGIDSFFKSNRNALKIKRKLLNLPLLPAQHIPNAYSHIKSFAQRKKISKKLKALFGYFERFWLVQVWQHLLVMHEIICVCVCVCVRVCLFFFEYGNLVN